MMTSRRSARIGVYADVDLNYIDGSSVWLISLCSVLSHVPDLTTYLVLKAPIERDVLAKDLRTLENLVVVEPDDRLSPQNASQVMLGLDETEVFDVVLVRGRAVSMEMLEHDRIARKLWAYLTDVPQTRTEMASREGQDLLNILSRSSRVLCQTEWLRAWFSALVPDADAKLLLLPPMVPPEAFREHSGRNGREGLHLLYAGKFAPSWGVVESVREVERLADDGVKIELTIAGDKIHEPPDVPSFAQSVRSALHSGVVTWVGGIERSQVFELLDNTDLALSVRSKALDKSKELSTKLLEYSAAGVPVLANRTLAHVELFGADYPLLVDSFEEMRSTIHNLYLHPERLDWLSARVRNLANDYSYRSVSRRLDRYLQAAPPARNTALNGRRVLVAGHEFKFISGLMDDWAVGGADLTLDQWQGHGTHDKKRSHELATEKDLILCEWMLGNADFYSRAKPQMTPLIVRFHRMELETKWPQLTDTDSVDQLVFVSDHTRREAIQKFGFDAESTTVIPNGVDDVAFDRSKPDSAAFTLGMAGFLPRLKRIDRALDLLIELRLTDTRYRLVLKGRQPWDLPWVWNNREERAYFEAVRDRIQKEPLLTDAVVFDRHGPDVAAWFTQVGYVLSPSDIESFHLALVEGMASGAVPVVWRRTGADEIVDPVWVHESTKAAGEWILSTRDSFELLSHRAATEAREGYSLTKVRSMWDTLFSASLARYQPSHPFENSSPIDVPPIAEETVDEIVTQIVGTHPYRYTPHEPTPNDFEHVDRMLNGQFSPSGLFDPIDWDLPPDWTTNPSGNRSWDFHRHSLEWLEPVIRVAAHGDDRALEAVERTVADWIDVCSKPPGPTHYVWNDHTAAIRTRLLLFMLHILGVQDRLNSKFAGLVIASLIQHGSYLTDARFYVAHSNHGLEMDASLLVLAANLRSIPYAATWEEIARSRLEKWLIDNFSDLGVHLEQSPGYHLFVTMRLLTLLSFFRENRLTAPNNLAESVQASLAVWPHFRRPDGSAPMIGDTPRFPRPVDWAKSVVRLAGAPPRSVAPQTNLNPRNDQDSFFVDAEAGYAIFADRLPRLDDEEQAATPTTFHLVVKCNNFQSPHFHYDLGSFVLWAHGDEWLVDSGYYSMEESTEERRYMRSRQAHNVVIVGDEEPRLHRSSVVDAGRSKVGDFVVIRHQLPMANHTRTVRAHPNKGEVLIRDVVEPTASHMPEIRQLFHVHPRLEVVPTSGSKVDLRDEEGWVLRLTQEEPTLLTRLSGDVNGEESAWYSPDYMKRTPSQLLSFAPRHVNRSVTFVTRLRLSRTDELEDELALA